MSDPVTQVEKLRISVARVERIQGSAALSIAMMALGIAVLVGGIALTAARVGPLESRAASLRSEIDTLEQDALDKRGEFSRSIDSAQKALASARQALSTAQRQLDSINLTLRRLADTGALTPAAHAGVTRALERGQIAEASLTSAEGRLLRVPPSGEPSENVDVLIERLFDASSVVRLRAYDDLMAQYADSPALVTTLLRYASEHTGNLNGIYNTLVVLNTVPLRQLSGRTQTSEVLAFLARVEGLGPRIRARTKDVRDRLSTSRSADQ